MWVEILWRASVSSKIAVTPCLFVSTGRIIRSVRILFCMIQTAQNQLSLTHQTGRMIAHETDQFTRQTHWVNRLGDNREEIFHCLIYRIMEPCLGGLFNMNQSSNFNVV